MKVDLDKIVSVAGKPGIYQLISGGKQATIVESLIDGKRIPVYPTQKVSTLGDISMFTEDGDMPLRDILLNAKKVYDGGAAPDHKSDSKVLREAMKKIVPNYDSDRVYDSDIKKLIQWYNILQAKDMLDIASTEEAEASAATEEAVVEAEETTKEEKTPKAKKAPAKKAAAKSKSTAEKAEKPAPKKAVAKKSTAQKKG